MKEKQVKEKVVIKIDDLNNLKERAKKAKEMEKQMKKMEEEKSLLKDKYIRTLADFDNYKKRVEKEKQDIFKFGTENLVLQLLPFDDIFESVLKQMDNNPSPETIHKGVEMLKREFTKFLEGIGVKKIDTKGTPFNPEIHEASETVETEEYKEGEVIEEIRSGYSFHNRVIRPALVKVAKKPECKTSIDSDENSCSSKG
ncbi:MAG: nucleotide exchange factor GrpE [Candidatus Omnitrophica bacterium]|nr:nucleotide exchange factor GrpE [Candidatus Omnitrophota bacterium]MCM8777300.1 nucleotide exchange factor GrpE [Candidatus Omnitrophota bacterium]